MDMSKTIRVLSNVALISSASFGKATPAEQTAALTTAAGKPVVFVADFPSLLNKKALVDKLLAGEDVQMLLEFNEIELTPEEFAMVSRISPILEKIRGKVPAYPWLEEKEFNTFTQTVSSIRRNGYSVGKKTAKLAWDRASAYWCGVMSKPATRQMSMDGYNRELVITQEYIKSGCQEVSRQEVEHIARKMGWEPNVTGEK